MWEAEKKRSVCVSDREEKKYEREGRLSISPDCFSSCTSSCLNLYDVYFQNNQPVLILRHIPHVSSLREQPVRFITVFLEVQSTVQCQDLLFCWAVCGFLRWHKTTGEKHSQASRKQSEADMHSKTNVCPEKRLIKQTDGAQNTVKTMRKNKCLCKFVCMSNLYCSVRVNFRKFCITQMDFVRSVLKSVGLSTGVCKLGLQLIIIFISNQSVHNFLD